jgi:uncharacterized membrane protein
LLLAHLLPLTKHFRVKTTAAIAGRIVGMVILFFVAFCCLEVGGSSRKQQNKLIIRKKQIEVADT